jgi:hypothetical protein
MYDKGQVTADMCPKPKGPTTELDSALPLVI